ncbi:MAG: lamin tail domain-containing protein [Prevotellaceae bacterium]|jgi:flagellar hook assembly protein FlgD|nr:lamin tail domain-containing protein [Prevotellaceae bacterium]
MKCKLFILILSFPILLNAQIAENFETQNIGNWKQTPENRWAASQTEALEGNFSLKHVFDNSATGHDRISVPVDNIDVTAGNVTWKFLIRHGYNPSSSNHWATFLMSSKDAGMMMKDSAVNAYAIGVNLVGSSDIIYLYKITDGIVSQLVNTNINWETAIKSTGKAAIEITRKTDGEWNIRIDQTGSFENFEAAGTPIIDTEHSDFNHFGLLYIYTSSADQRLWFDKLTITSSILPAQIASVEQLSKTQLSISLSKAIKSTGNINLIDQNGKNVNIISQNIEGQNSDKIIVTTKPLHGRKFTVAINNLIDMDNIMANASKTFFIDNFDFGDIVFNEIMFRPEPVVGLPERKYIELYNRTQYGINMKDWKILYGTAGEARIAADSIAANSYAIICTSSAVADLSPYGKAISAVSFPTLTYSGQNLKLVDSENNLIAALNYLPDWHNDTDKIAGGWSLEKIDFDNLSELSNNWKSSNDEKGGTPGQKNSVSDENPDKEPPVLAEWEILDNNKLHLVFNEPINTETASQIETYFVDNNIENPVNVITDYNEVLLIFNDIFETGVIYNLDIQNSFADIAGNHLVDFNLAFGIMHKPQNNDIIINEALFNPYPNGVDFVEIYNRSQKNIDIKDLFLATRNKSTGLLQSIRQVQFKSNFLRPQQFIVLTADPEIVNQQYYVQNPENMIMMEQMPAYPNTDGTVVLLDEQQNIIDEFTYNENMHFEFLTSVEGVSLERTSYEKPTNDANNWHSASSDVGYATPTRKNSQAEFNSEKYGFDISPQTFAPDNSGIDDELHITYAMPEPGYIANIKIYDSQGRWITNVQNNALLGSQGGFTWNGYNDKKQKVSIGVYIVYIEYFNLQGKIKIEKKTCIVAARK